MRHTVRPFVPGGTVGAMTPPDFSTSLNPISTRGRGVYAPITTGTPGFSELLTALPVEDKKDLPAKHVHVENMLPPEKNW